MSKRRPGSRRPAAPVRKRAAPTASTFDDIRIKFLCPECGKNNLQRLAELVVNDETACGACGRSIRIDTEDWRTRLAQEREKFEKIKPPPFR
jgi:rubredoxin